MKKQKDSLKSIKKTMIKSINNCKNIYQLKNIIIAQFGMVMLADGIIDKWFDINEVTK